MAEIIKGPFSYNQARVFLAKLMDESRSFKGGSHPVVGRLNSSYGYKKIIGVNSFDNKTYTRIDYDPEKGVHFNFVDDNAGVKICILIKDMTEEQYKKHIDNLTFGKDIDEILEISKSAIIRYDPKTGIKLDYDEKTDSYFYHADKGRKKKLYTIVKGVSQDAYQKILDEMTKLSPKKATTVPKASVSAPEELPGSGFNAPDDSIGFIRQVYPEEIFVLDEFMFLYYAELYAIELEEAKQDDSYDIKPFDEFITVNVARNYDEYLKANNLYDEDYDKKANLRALLSQVVEEENDLKHKK